MLLSPEILAHIVPARRLEQRRGYRSTGVQPLDELLGGGWPRAALAELRGRRSSGRTSILYASLARSIAARQTVALVDCGGSLDPRLAQAAGIALPRLLWIRSGSAEAVKAADLVVSAGGFDLVALDVGDARPRIPSAAWIRLKHGAEKQGTTILVVTPTSLAGAFASTTVELSAAAPQFEGRPLLTGLRAQATRVRGKQDFSGDFHGGATCAWLAFSHQG